MCHCVADVCVCAWQLRRWACMPRRTYVVMVALFFVVNVVNNQALNFNIAMPLHMIFRAVSITLCVTSTPDYVETSAECLFNHCAVYLVVIFKFVNQKRLGICVPKTFRFTPLNIIL